MRNPGLGVLLFAVVVVSKLQRQYITLNIVVEVVVCSSAQVAVRKNRIDRFFGQRVNFNVQKSDDGTG